MRKWWSPDLAFFDLLRDKQAIGAMAREIAGDGPTDAHLAFTAKVQKKFIADCLDGTRQPVVED
jgi:ParB family chromosome partitioning protein